MKTEFRIPVLDSIVYLMSGNSMVKMVKEMMADHGEARDDEWYKDFEDYDACVFKVSDGENSHGMLFKSSKLSDELVAHESWHLVWSVCKDSGIKICNNEVCANIMGSIVGQVTTLLLVDRAGKSKKSSNKNPKT